jgi:hypothetical protein
MDAGRRAPGASASIAPEEGKADPPRPPDFGTLGAAPLKLSKESLLSPRPGECARVVGGPDPGRS